MDSALEKIGLYDFFGVLISGMVSITVCHLLQLPVMSLITVSSNSNNGDSAIDVLLFLLTCYAIGLMLQEVGSLLDKYIWQLRERARTTYLKKNSKIIGNKYETQKIVDLAKKILNEDADNLDAEKCEYIYHYCKTRLEVQNKNEKINRINSLYGMSRSLLVSIPLITLAYSLCNKEGDSWILLVVGACFVWCMFYKRAQRFAEYRVCVVFRQYMDLCENSQNEILGIKRESSENIGSKD